MLTHPSRESTAMTYVAAICGVIAVGAIDFVTGADIHVLSLYFVPIAIAGWRLGRTGAVIVSLLATLVWLAALYTTGSRFAHHYVWIVNFVTQGIAFLTVSMLFSVLVESRARERALSRVDALTGLSNRRALAEQATGSLLLCRRNARPVSVAYIDLDNFKSVNDLFGHARGDELLRECGRVIRQSLRASDIAARIGGDEFVIFLPETTTQNAVVLMERLRNELEVAGTFRTAGVTASIGVVVDDSATLDIDELLRQADAEMYRVKANCKNRVSSTGSQLNPAIEHSVEQTSSGSRPASAAPRRR